MNLARLLEEAARTCPNHRALIYGEGESITFSELNSLTNKLGNGLKQLGVQPNDKVGLMINNSPEWVAAWFGLTKIGSILVPIGAFYQATEVDYIIEKAEIETLFVGEEYLEVVEQLKTKQGLKNIIVVGEHRESWISFKQLVESQSENLTMEERAPSDLCAIWYTSGTTRFPKGVMMDHYGFGCHSSIVPEMLLTTPDDIMLSGVPCTSIVSKVTISGMFASKTPTVLLPRFSAPVALELIDKLKVTVFYGVPTMVLYMIEELEKRPDKYNLESLKTIITSAAPQAEKDVSRLQELLPNVTYLRFYGATETIGGGPQTHISDYRLFGYQPDCIGRATRGSEVKIVDEKGEEVSVGEQGELIWRGFGLMKGYWKEPELTAEVIRNGWYHSGDLARKDERGMYYLTGRIKDVINCAGFKVFPKEVEDVLKEHPAVLDCAVAAVADDVKGEIPVAWVVAKEGKNVSSEVLIKHCRSEIAHYKAPRNIFFVQEIPRNAIGKVDRKQLVSNR